MLWKILDRLYGLDLIYKNTAAAISQRKAFLIREQLGICDVVASAYRQKIDASDLGMTQIILRDLLLILQQNPLVDTLIFTGGASKNGPEYFFRQLLKKQQIKMVCVSASPPKKHRFLLAAREVITYSLTAPSGSANRAIGQMPKYKAAKLKDPHFTTFDFRLE